ncbi:hypothetical protein C8R45DRAFT_1095311 [Mycena sanguinolenta]|nr:hypothetical protein C8R45DRAFT_1095311 [Mycena sanguinolenta]
MRQAHIAPSAIAIAICIHLIASVALACYRQRRILSLPSRAPSRSSRCPPAVSPLSCALTSQLANAPPSVSLPSAPPSVSLPSRAPSRSSRCPPAVSPLSCALTSQLANAPPSVSSNSALKSTLTHVP